MGSKTFVFLGLPLLIALLIISDVSARDLAETKKNNVAATIDQGGYGKGCPRGRCGDRCCEDAEAEFAKTEATTSEEKNVAATIDQTGGGGCLRGRCGPTRCCEDAQAELPKTEATSSSGENTVAYREGGVGSYHGEGGGYHGEGGNAETQN